LGGHGEASGRGGGRGGWGASGGEKRREGRGGYFVGAAIDRVCEYVGSFLYCSFADV